VHEHRLLCCCVSARRAMDHRRAADEERITWLESLLKETSEAATESERKYEEVSLTAVIRFTIDLKGNLCWIAGVLFLHRGCSF